MLCILKISLVVTHAFIQERIKKTSSGIVFMFCCYKCARLTWGHLYIHPFTGNTSDMLPERDPVKKSTGRPDLGNDCKSHNFFKYCWNVCFYSFEELLLGLEFCCWNLEKFHL